jgi:hypothetical protein
VTKEQFSKLQRGFDKNANYVDIDYDVGTGKYSAVIKGGGAITASLRMWLQSKKSDYHRRPDFGGFFGNLLNDRYALSPDNEESVRTELVAEINAKFPDVTVVAAEVRADMSKRGWIVRVVVQDLRTKILADDLATSNEGLLIRPN